MTMGNLYQSGDWKGEKHVPVIHAPEKVKAAENFEVMINVGEAIGHPNTLEHHIAWFKLYYLPEGGKLPIELGTWNFSAHGESDTFTEPKVNASVQLAKSGKLIATSYCNIHGLWENSVDVVVE